MTAPAGRQSYVLTGASGGGKSTLLAALAEHGVAVVPEVGREIVREGVALPWEDPVGFRDAAFWRSIKAYDAAPKDRPVVFDRSFVEALAHATEEAPLSAEMLVAMEARPFAETVFVCPPWPEIFRQDSERRHGFDTALAQYGPETEAYRRLGHRLLVLPKGSVTDRAKMVLAEITRGTDR